MNKKLLKVMSDKCKDMGLTEKAIEDLTVQGSEGLTEESSDEDIEKAANLLVPFAKLMQSEGTRWAQKKQPKKEPKDGDGEGGKGDDEKRPRWFEEYRTENDKKIKALEDENVALKSEKAKNERQTLISAKAKELGIPEYLMKRYHIADDADYEKELTEYKQDLVTNKLMPASSGENTSTIEEAQKTAATSMLDECEVKTV